MQLGKQAGLVGIASEQFYAISRRFSESSSVVAAAIENRRDELAEKARQGTLTIKEERDLESYRQAGRILELMRAKARISLQKTKLAS